MYIIKTERTITLENNVILAIVLTVHIVNSFDWTPEQWVPNMTSSHHLADEDPCPLSWPSEHRLFPLQPPPVGTRPALVLRLEAESGPASDPSQHKGNTSLLTIIDLFPPTKLIYKTLTLNYFFGSNALKGVEIFIIPKNNL